MKRKTMLAKFLLINSIFLATQSVNANPNYLRAITVNPTDNTGLVDYSFTNRNDDADYKIFKKQNGTLQINFYSYPKVFKRTISFNQTPHLVNSDTYYNVPTFTDSQTQSWGAYKNLTATYRFGYFSQPLEHTDFNVGISQTYHFKGSINDYFNGQHTQDATHFGNQLNARRSGLINQALLNCENESTRASIGNRNAFSSWTNWFQVKKIPRIDLGWFGNYGGQLINKTSFGIPPQLPKMKNLVECHKTLEEFHPSQRKPSYNNNRKRNRLR